MTRELESKEKKLQEYRQLAYRYRNERDSLRAQLNPPEKVSGAPAVPLSSSQPQPEPPAAASAVADDAVDNDENGGAVHNCHQQ